ncbi:hypothetical protein TIFTF001_010649 [Ficus carica]|uniref:Uncharacterized protein n=1 Tax=Ficus carica TaxID=3494 RepID=A0AA87ZQF5_FICCA|nr:hypothetical protein TIFTF001_010649 [Ficus carica]
MGILTVTRERLSLTGMMSVGATTGNGGQRDGEWQWLRAVARKNGSGGCCKEDEDGGSSIVFLNKKVMRGVRDK